MGRPVLTAPSALGLTTLVKLLQKVAPDEPDPKFKEAVQTCLALPWTDVPTNAPAWVVWTTRETWQPTFSDAKLADDLGLRRSQLFVR